MIPLLLDLRQREVCIFGAGKVALRKARLFSQYTRVRVVSESFLKEFEELPVERVTARVADPAPYIGDAIIVIPATDDRQLNGRIAEVARGMGRLVDSVDEVGDVIVPSIIRRGDLVIAISTSGRSPATAKHLRERLEEVIGPSWEGMVRLQSRLRELLKERVPGQAEREAILHRCVEDNAIWKALEEGKEERAWELALRVAGLENRA
jgi:precorrin-2 dehydrogenase/sirohydrochlorin ferrochelatase